RDLGVTMGTGAGVMAGANSTLRLLRCLIDSNSGGPGIQTTNAAFDIENTVIAKNGMTVAANGVTLGATSATPTIFRNNTVVQNAAIGVACVGSFTVTGSIISGNGGNAVLSCTANDACAMSCTTNLMLNASYQLTTNSPAGCKDVLGSA